MHCVCCCCCGVGWSKVNKRTRSSLQFIHHNAFVLLNKRAHSSIDKKTIKFTKIIYSTKLLNILIRKKYSLIVNFVDSIAEKKVFFFSKWFLRFISTKYNRFISNNNRFNIYRLHILMRIWFAVYTASCCFHRKDI